MGRVKLRIKRLESLSNRQVTYSKRRNGLLKKAKELSILCDIDICLLLFPPTGKAALFHGERSSLEEVVAKFAQKTPQERAKRKLEGLEALKKTFLKEGHDVNIQDFLGPSNQTIEDLCNHLRLLQSRLTEVHRRLSFWSNPDKIDDIELLNQMEDSLKELLNRASLSKENFQKQQHVPLECTSQEMIMQPDLMSQFQDGLHFPMVMSSIQEGEPLSWFPQYENEHMQHLLSTQDPNFLPQREMQSLTEASFSGYSSYGCTSGYMEMGNTGQICSTGQERSSLNQFSRISDMGLELDGQFLYHPPYCHLNFSDDNKLKQRAEMNLQGNSMDFQVSSNFELNRQMYDGGIPSSGPCVSMFNDYTYPQEPDRISLDAERP